MKQGRKPKSCHLRIGAQSLAQAEKYPSVWKAIEVYRRHAVKQRERFITPDVATLHYGEPPSEKPQYRLILRPTGKTVLKEPVV
jgi:hypothetical protein